MKIRTCSVLLVLLASFASGTTDDSLWISHYSGNDGWFAFQGPQRAMKLDPGDFGLEHPVAVESLKSWFYWGMGSREDSVITFRIYGADGATLLFESDSISVSTANWVYYGLPQAVVVDSGPFYIATTHRLVNPWAHPYVNVDDNPSPTHSYYGSPGGWQVDNVGEYCFYAYVCESATGLEAGDWLTGSRTASTGVVIAGTTLRLPEHGDAKRSQLLDGSGRKVMDLRPGDNDVGAVAPGVYFIARRAVVCRVVLAK